MGQARDGLAVGVTPQQEALGFFEVRTVGVGAAGIVLQSGLYRLHVTAGPEQVESRPVFRELPRGSTTGLSSPLSCRMPVCKSATSVLLIR